MSSTKKRLREIEEVVSKVTEDFEVTIKRKNHVIVTISRNGRTKKLFTSKTPSDKRGMMNFRAVVRSAYDQMAITKEDYAIKAL